MATTTTSVAAGHRKSLGDANMSVKEHRRAQIEAKITRLNQSVIKLKSELNMLSPISVLPQEILAEIFITLSEAVDYTAFDYPHLGRRHDVRFLITHVCAHWRAVALSCPTLWATLKVPSVPGVLQEVLERAKCAPLRLDACIQAHRILPKNQTMSVLGHLSHMRALSITATSGTLNKIIDNMDGPTPLLESLKLIDTDYRSLYGPVVPTLPSASLRIEPRTPIRELELTNFPFRWTDIAFRSLSHLKLRCHRGRNAGPDNSFKDFINALENMPLLEVLELEHATPSLLLSVTEIPAPTRIITLTRLHTIRLFATTPVDCINVLSHLSFPALSIFFLLAQSTQHIKKLAKYLADGVPFWDRIRMLDCARNVPDRFRIEGSDSQERFSGVEEDYSSPRYAFKLVFIDSTSSPTILNSMFKHIPWRMVRTLYVSDLFYGSASQWVAAFRPLKQVTDLEVSGNPGTLELVHALCRRIPKAGKPTAASPKTSMRLFPLLRSISLNDVRFAERETYDVGLVGELTEPLLDCLTRRRDRGVKIRKLQITDCFHIDDRDIERLREIVPSVEWDSKVMADEPEYGTEFEYYDDFDPFDFNFPDPDPIFHGWW